MAEAPHSQLSNPPSIRKFLVQPVETKTKSTRSRRGEGKDASHGGLSAMPGSGLQPENINEQRGDRSREQDHRPKLKEAQQIDDTSATKADNAIAGSRRFAPQLIETTKRTRKKGDVTPALKHTDKTDLSPGDRVHLPRHMRLTRLNAIPGVPSNTPIQSADRVAQVKESRFSSSNLSKNVPRRTTFRVPHLEPIPAHSESEESNGSNVPSLSTTPSVLSDDIEVQRRASRAREAYSEGFSGYLLELAAKTARKQLKEQALAAYPNENEHEPVDHFAVDRDSDGSFDGIGYGMLPQDLEEMEHMTRRESAVGWNLEELQRHKEMLEEHRKQQQLLKQIDTNEPLSFADPFRVSLAWKAIQPPHTTEPPKATIGGPVQEAGELSKMRSAASPPMLGRDMPFPKCPSPQSTMIDPTQKPKSRTEGTVSRQHSGLWTPPNGATPNHTRKSSLTGLWHGVCNSTSNGCLMTPRSLQTGLLTPAVETEDPFGTMMANKHYLPSSPTNATVAGIDKVLSVEASIEMEYPDSFVTQIYNYLSLGYPALARKYDEELGKISKTSLADIRKDDVRANSKGYVGAPEGEGTAEKEVREHCGRWVALRLYITEWARQQPRMVAAGSDNWGARARKGSWAI